ncbi:hypothetical protein BIZ37_04130 [Photobacterium sp. BZF1]|uniref:hypothetical protein n=1 Tax=Photobacterium sp. BZF1 TaxID=1904457 RepID=UPI001653AEE9|nr:hypothetical protein [Photobacterium sp. BZF1]MBC7001731.1 hypothetical protein [Photobacterium sp. BZF1]
MDNNHTVTKLHKPDNPLNELLKQGAQQFLAQAIEAEEGLMGKIIVTQICPETCLGSSKPS